jgi:glyoxalase family protein
MENKILGIHHITAIAGNAQRNFDFYTRVLGLRLVKKTVNFDDPGTYHFYFGDEVGSPGTILTFFPWDRVKRGSVGTGMASEVAYSIAKEASHFWKKRFQENNVPFSSEANRFGDAVLIFEDPDGLKLSLIESPNDSRIGWSTKEINQDVALKGFHSTSLMLRSVSETASVLTRILDYTFVGKEGSRHRYQSSTVSTAAIIDLIEAPGQPNAINAGGTIHHVAFRVKDEETLMKYRAKVSEYGLGITPKVDRNYFYSLYFREPGGVLFEIATDNPGFAIDELVDELGKNLKLPAQYETRRTEIEKILPKLQIVN